MRVPRVIQGGGGEKGTGDRARRRSLGATIVSSDETSVETTIDDVRIILLIPRATRRLFSALTALRQDETRAKFAGRFERTYIARVKAASSRNERK